MQFHHKGVEAWLVRHTLSLHKHGLVLQPIALIISWSVAFPTAWCGAVRCAVVWCAAAAAGCCMVICTSQLPENIVDILDGARKGTKFYPLANSLKGRKRWLLTG